MRVLIMADELFASRERPLLERLEIGLADEGVRVIHGVPRSTRQLPGGGLQSRALTYAGNALPITVTLEARRLVRGVEEINAAEDGRPIDLVHVLGGSAWRLAREVARLLGAGLIAEVWRAGLASTAREYAGRVPPCLFIAPDAAIQRRLLADLGPDAPVRLAPWGVHAGLVPRQVLPPDRAWSAMFIGSGLGSREFAAALAGLAGGAGGAQGTGDLLIFADAMAAHRAGLWAHARALNLLSRLTLIEELEGRRDLLLSGDILVMPEANGEQRSVALEAMGSGMLLAAAADPMNSSLADGRTARLVGTPGDPAAWAAVLGDLTGNVARSRSLAASAGEYVRTHRRASEHVRAVLNAYQALAGQRAIPFPKGT